MAMSRITPARGEWMFDESGKVRSLATSDGRHLDEHVNSEPHIPDSALGPRNLRFGYPAR